MSIAKVVAIHLCAKTGGSPTPQESVNAIAHKGLEGDRFFGAIRNGQSRPEKAVTLIQAETIEALKVMGLVLEPGETRRNITTRGVDLNALVNRRFKVGEAILEGYELCDPCFVLEKRTGKKLRELLENRGGLRAYIRQSGVIRIDDAIEVDDLKGRGDG